MQKNNFKLKTIFKKGLSFSIALALGAAATSLNMAKIADAAEAVAGATARSVYVAGERFNNDGFTPRANYYKLEDSTTTAFTAFSATPFTVGESGTIYLGSEAGADTGHRGFQYTVVPTSVFTDVADANTISIADGTSFEDARTAILNNLRYTNAITLTQVNALVSAWGSTATFTIGSANFATGSSISYDSHNGKTVSIKLPNGPTFKVGKLEVTRQASELVLVSEPNNLAYAAGNKLDLTGLKVKATYTDGTSEEIAYDENTKNKFKFHNNADSSEIKADTGLTGTADVIVDVVVAGKEIEKAFTLRSAGNYSSIGDASSILVTGSFASGATLSVTTPTDADATKTLLEAMGGKQENVLFYSTLGVQPNAYSGGLTFKINVGKEHAGKVVTVGTIEDGKVVKIAKTVDSDGVVRFVSTTFGTYMIALGNYTGTTADSAENINGEEAAKKAAEASASKSGSSSAKTGDMSVIAFSVFGFVALISAAVLAYMKKARKSFDK